MIKSYKDYLFYLEADRIALGKEKKRPLFFGDEIWKYQRLLRKIEYYMNCKKSLCSKILYFLYRFIFHKYALMLGFEIPFNVCGPGLSIAHRGPIIIGPKVRIGRNCRIHSCVSIAPDKKPPYESPVIGDNVYIGPGAKLFGSIKIADGTAVGTGAIVTKSFIEENITIAGNPAKKISSEGSEGFIIPGAQLVDINFLKK